MFTIGEYSPEHDRLGSSWGWLLAAIPCLSLLALTAGAASGVATCSLTLIGIIAAGAQPALLAAIVIPMAITIGLATLLMPRTTGTYFSVILVVLIQTLWFQTPPPTVTILNLTAFTAVSAVTGITANYFRSNAQQGVIDVAQFCDAQIQIRNDERRKLAYELHDIVAHEITIIAMQARRAEFVSDALKNKQIIESIADSAQQSLQDLRKLVILLKTDSQETCPESATFPSLREIEGNRGRSFDQQPVATADFGLLNDLRSIRESMSHAGFTTELLLDGDIYSLPLNLHQALRPSIREIATNILKHGDPSVLTTLQLSVCETHVLIRASNGVSSTQSLTSSSTGLDAMRSRCQIFGGELRAAALGGIWFTELICPLAHAGTITSSKDQP